MPHDVGISFRKYLFCMRVGRLDSGSFPLQFVFLPLFFQELSKTDLATERALSCAGSPERTANTSESESPRRGRNSSFHGFA